MAIAMRTDEEIQQDVLRELKFDAQLQPNEIGVVVKDGIVTLAGWVDSYLKKWAAEEAAHRVHGVKAVVNDIEVRLPVAAERTDPEVAAAVIRALEWDAGIPTDRIEVTVSKGWVTLRGEVDWGFQRADAERVVRRITGVRGVTNLITVKPRQQLTPDQIRKAIEQALIRSAETDAKRIEVTVDGDKVSLKGTVRSWAEKMEVRARRPLGREPDHGVDLGRPGWHSTHRSRPHPGGSPSARGWPRSRTTPRSGGSTD
jgi:osmotically-inducible protein OsmY